MIRGVAVILAPNFESTTLPVPVPPTLLPPGSGLLGLVGWRKKLRKVNQT